MCYRPKMGFVTPISAWFRGALADEAQVLAVSKTLSATGWFDMRAVQYIADDHRAGKAEHGRTLWQLFMPERSLERVFGLASKSPGTACGGNWSFPVSSTQRMLGSISLVSTPFRLVGLS